MAANSKIQWTDNTWNPAIGCTKVSPGCKFCYMMRDMGGRFNKDVNGVVTRTSDSTFFKPLAWQKQGLTAPDGRKLKVFTSSLTDIFHPAIDEYRDEIWDVIRQCPDLIFQILTKRPERIPKYLPGDWGDGWDNVWIGTSVENQEMYNSRLRLMFDFPAKTRFLSIEPLLDRINLDKFDDPNDVYLLGKMDWIIIGGESGNETGKWRYRECELEWIHFLSVKALSWNIPVFVKQLGTHLSKEFKLKDRHGGDKSEWPNESFFPRMFPENY